MSLADFDADSAAGLPPSGPASTGLATLRAGFEGSGSPRWLMRTIQTAGFDRAHGFALELVLLSEGSHRHGTLQALADDRVDVVDADRLALAAAQADGLPVTAIHPYGRILGSLVARGDFCGAPGRGLATLRGCRIGVLSIHDKNWRLLTTACAELASFNIEAAVRPVLYASRAELVAALLNAQVDTALVHWHLVPRLVAAGHRVLAELPELADALANMQANMPANAAGSAAVPTTFFVARQNLIDTRPALLTAFVAATTDAVQRLRDDDLAWQTLASDGAIAATDRPHLADLRARWQNRIGRYFNSSSSSSLSWSIPCNPF